MRDLIYLRTWGLFHMKIGHIIRLIKKGSHADSAPELIVSNLESLAFIDDDALQKRLLKDLIRNYVLLEKRVDALLKNTLPPVVADEIKYEGTFLPRAYASTIMFTDFVGFTHLAEKCTPLELVGLLNTIFSEFDELVDRNKGTKIKTIGDSYMAVFGAPEACKEHAVMAIRSAMAMLEFLNRFNIKEGQRFNMRIGIHTGNVMAGVVGRDRMQFDVFGDDVNIASRFESSGVINRINVSGITYKAAELHFDFEERGFITLKNKDPMPAYLVTGSKTEEQTNITE